MNLLVRRWFNFVEHNVDAGDESAPPLRKVAVAAVVENPYAGQHVEDLRPMIAASEELGRNMGKVLLETLGPYEDQELRQQAGIAGLAGEQGTSANALHRRRPSRTLSVTLSAAARPGFLRSRSARPLVFRSMFRWRARMRCTSGRITMA